jgi:hypothetical protein
MSFLLGSFSDGLLGGAHAIAEIHGMNQENQMRQARIDAGNDVAAAAAAGDPRALGYMDPAQQGQSTAISVPDPTTVGNSALPSAERTQPADLTQYGPPAAGAKPATPAQALPTPTPATTPQATTPQADPPVESPPASTGAAPTPAPIAPYATPPVVAAPAPGAAPAMTAPSNMATYDTPVGGYVARPAAAQGPATAGQLPVVRGDSQADPNMHPTAADVAAQALPPAQMPTGPNLGVVTNAPVGNNVGRWMRGDPPNPPAGGPTAGASGGAPPSGTSLGSRIWAAIPSPIGSAQAAELPPARTDTPAAPKAALDTPPAPAAAPAANPTPGTPQGTTGPGGTKGTPAAPVAAPASGRATKPAQQGSSIEFPTGVNQVAPNQQGGTVQTEPNTPVARPNFDLRPYAFLAKEHPDQREMVDRIAAANGISPQRLALHWQLEGSMRTQVPNGAAGERGAMQVIPATQDSVDPKHQLDPNKLEDSLTMGARVIKLADARFGQDTPTSIYAYQQGEGNAAKLASGEAPHPNGRSYLEKAYNGQAVPAAAFTGPINVDAKQAMQAGLQGGPDGLLTYIAQTGSPQQPLSDKWRAAEVSMLRVAAMSGDPSALRHTQDYLLQMSQQGHTTSIINAYQAMQAGDGATAAQQLARANSFFPDGSMGRFGVDAAGNVWGQKVDEHDPSIAITPHFQVTPDKLQQMMITSRDPQLFQQQLQASQKAVAETRLSVAREGYYKDLLGSKERMTRERLEGQKYQTEERLAGQVFQAQQRSADRQYTADSATDRAEIAAGAKRDALNTKIDAELQHNYPPTMSDPATGAVVPAADRATMSIAHRDLRTNKPDMTAAEASEISQGLVGGTHVMRPITSGAGAGNYAVQPKNENRTVGVISGATAQQIAARLRGGGRPGAAPPAATTTVVPQSSAAVPRQALN